MKYIFPALIFAFSMFASPSLANQERFDQAITAWLDMDNETALPLMSELAHEGYEPAMLFLGSLDLQRHSLSIIGLRTIPREYIRTLTFKPGESWLTQVEDDQAIAWAIRGHTHHARENITWSVKITKPEQSMEAGFTLAQRGEFVLAAQKFGDALGSWQPTQNEAQYFVAQNYPDYIKPYQWLVGVQHLENPDERGEVIKELQAQLNLGSLSALFFHQRYFRDVVNNWPQKLQIFALMSNFGYYHFDPSEAFDPQYISEFERLLVNDNIAEPLVNYCSKTCPGEINRCTGMLYTALGGYTGMVWNHAPLQSVIPDEQYFASAQFENSLRTRGQHYDVLVEDLDYLDLGSCTTALAMDLGGEE